LREQQCGESLAIAWEVAPIQARSTQVIGVCREPTKHQRGRTELLVAVTNPGCGRSFSALGTGKSRLWEKRQSSGAPWCGRMSELASIQILGATKPTFERVISDRGYASGDQRGDRAQRRLRQRPPQDPRIEWSDSGLPPIHFCLASEQTTSVRSPATSRKNWTRHAARWRLISSVWTDSCALHLRTDADVTTLVMQVAQRGRPQAWPGGKRQRARPR
jgi:hypothetical protein